MREIYKDVRAKKNKIIGQADDLSKVFGWNCLSLLAML